MFHVYAYVYVSLSMSDKSDRVEGGGDDERFEHTRVMMPTTI